jgi:hypothetical protein
VHSLEAVFECGQALQHKALSESLMFGCVIQIFWGACTLEQLRVGMFRQLCAAAMLVLPKLADVTEGFGLVGKSAFVTNTLQELRVGLIWGNGMLFRACVLLPRLRARPGV